MSLALPRFGPFRRLVVFGLAATTAFVGLQLVLSALGYAPTGADPAYFALLCACLLAAHAIVLFFFHDGDWSVVGLGAVDRAPRRLAFGAAVGALAIAIPTGALLATGQLLRAPAPAGDLLVAAARLALVLAPAALFEELLMRGYLLTALGKLLTPEAGVAVTSVIFSALHFRNPSATTLNLLAVALAGFFLGIMRLQLGLWAATAAHFAWNFTMAALFHTAVSGLPLALPAWTLVDNGPDWVTGGAWGPEGGLAAMIGMAAVLWILRRRERRGSATS